MVTIDSKRFAEITAWAARSVGLRPEIPIMACVLLEADGETLTARGFDHELSSTAVAAIDGGELQVAVGGRMLAAVAAKLDGQVELTHDGGRLAIRCGRDRYALSALPAGDAPPSTPVGAELGQVDAGQFASALSKAAIAIDPKSPKPEMQFAHLQAAGGTLTLTGTSRVRAVRLSIPWPGSDFDVYAQPAALRTLLTGVSGPLTLWGGGVLGLSTEGRTATIRLGAEPHPEQVDRVFRLQPATLVRVPRAALVSALERLELVAVDTDLCISMNVGPSRLDLRTVSGMEDADVTVPAEVNGQYGPIGLDPRYLRTCAADIDTEVLNLRCEPGQINYPVILDGPDHRAVIVPRKLP